MFIVCWVFCNVFFSDSLKKVKAGPIMQIASSFKRLSSLQGLPHRSPKAMTILFFLLLLFYAAMILLPWKTSINKARKWKKHRKREGKKERKVGKIIFLAWSPKYLEKMVEKFTSLHNRKTYFWMMWIVSSYAIHISEEKTILGLFENSMLTYFSLLVLAIKNPMNFLPCIIERRYA